MCNDPFKGRGHYASKTYVAVYVCLTTRAVHVELVLSRPMHVLLHNVVAVLICLAIIQLTLLEHLLFFCFQSVNSFTNKLAQPCQANKERLVYSLHPYHLILMVWPNRLLDVSSFLYVESLS